MNHTLHRTVTTLAAIAFAALASMAAAPTQPPTLGNFSVNHHTGLVLRPDRIDAHIVIDRAEIAALQERPTVDADRDGRVSETESRAYAEKTCSSLSGQLHLNVDGTAVDWSRSSAALEYQKGEAGLQTSRLTCRLSAPAELGAPAEIQAETDYDTTRVGWHEMTATSQGLSITRATFRHVRDPRTAPVPGRSPRLRTRPAHSGTEHRARTGGDPAGGGGPPRRGRDQRSAGQGDRGLRRPRRGPRDHAPGGTAGSAPRHRPGGLPRGDARPRQDHHGRLPRRPPRHQTRRPHRRRHGHPHAHGRCPRSRSRSAGLHPPGRRIRPDVARSRQRTLVTGIGLWLLNGAVRGRPQHNHHHHHHGPHHGHSHSDGGHHHHHGPGHSHGDGGHHHGHDHGPDGPHDHGPVASPTMPGTAPAADLRPDLGVATLAPPDHEHLPSSTSTPPKNTRRASRSGLVGMGIAGGLVPSPSALVVLLGAVALGRTAFGVLLVIGYGLGMAATLTIAGLLLVRLRERIESHDRTRTLRHNPSSGSWYGPAPSSPRSSSSAWVSALPSAGRHGERVANGPHGSRLGAAADAKQARAPSPRRRQPRMKPESMNQNRPCASFGLSSRLR